MQNASGIGARQAVRRKRAIGGMEAGRGRRAPDVGVTCYPDARELPSGRGAIPSFPVDGPGAPCDASGAAGPGWARPPSFLAHGRAMVDSIPMTRAGAEAIKRELKRLKSVERP